MREVLLKLRTHFDACMLACIPLWMTPNMLTGFRFIAIVPVAGAYFYLGPWWALLIYAGACITDYLDGLVARARNLTSAQGKALDPNADKMLVGGLVVLFWFDGKLTFWPLDLITLLILLNIFREVSICVGRRLFQKSESIEVIYLAKWKAAFQMGALGLLMVIVVPSGAFAFRELLLITTGLALVTGFQYMWLTVYLYVPDVRARVIAMFQLVLCQKRRVRIRSTAWFDN